MAADEDNNIYVGTSVGDIYRRIGGIGSFDPLGVVSQSWVDITVAPNGDVYAIDYGGDIYKQTGGKGDFNALGQTSRDWYGITAAPDGDIYACVYNGDIYKQTGGSGDFNALGQTTRYWYGMTAAPDGDIYASVHNGDIYMQTGGSGNFNALGQTTRNWRGMSADPNTGDIWVVVSAGDIYKQTGGSGNFNATGQTSRLWRGITVAPNGDIYASVQTGDIYKKSEDEYELSGIYTSPVYDRGSSNRYMVYVMADIVVTGEGLEWSDILPLSTTLWAEIDLTRPWYQIFELEAGPTVEMQILYGTSSPPANPVEKMEILSGIMTGRYFQVRIKITDPSVNIHALVEHFTLKFCQ